MQISRVRRDDHSDLSSASLGVLEFYKLPFLAKRVYWLSKFVTGVSRGNHAHKTLNQVMIMISGQLELELSFGYEKTTILLNEKSDYILVPAGFWRVMRNASMDAVLLVVADSEYLEEDYIRNWNEYIKWHLGERLGR
jgi:dTDP-4-dehydrorhamnose 3,5-epimerase-like enzyme